MKNKYKINEILDAVNIILNQKDNVTEKNERENFQANATETKDGYYLVPKVIE